MSYDKNNIFAKIIRGEIPCKKVYEDEYALAFHDIHPQAPVHILVIPKGEYTSLNEFAALATDAEIAALTRALAKVAEIAGVKNSGYRTMANTGLEGGQEVPHLHFHIFGGKRLGRMVSKTVMEN